MSGAGMTLFVVSGLVAFIGAIMTVMARRPMRAAVGLLIHIVALAGLFLTLHAHLLAALQLLVYAGAVVVLFVFVVMLIGPASEVAGSRANLGARAIGFAAISCLMLMVAFATSSVSVPHSEASADFGTIEALGMAIYRHAFVPFELVSITLLVAIVGAIAVASSKAVKKSE